MGGSSFSKELKLAKHLQELCDDDGKETKPTESANVLNDFGLLFKGKSPDKISLIQSATFFNAAIVRQPTKKEFKENLQDLCSHVLQAAGAQHSKTNLCLISNQAFELVKKMRDFTKASLHDLNTIPSGLPEEQLCNLEEKYIQDIRQLQIEISEQYTNLMNFVGNQSIDIMGVPPCKYSITGMGSLARKEITPFSDFEHIIVLEEGVQERENYEEILEYFRWVSVIFHIIIINLKETIVRSVAVTWLNDDSITGGDWFFDNFTTCGIKFDGMQLPACKIPLGRTWKTDNKPFTVELIKPITEMAHYLEVEEEIKNGYHLADVLTKTCFVSGHKDVHVRFQEEVKKILSQNELINYLLIIKDVNKYAEDFDTIAHTTDLLTSPTCSIKVIMYRASTLFVSALGRIHSINKYSCFDIIDEMFDKQLINNKTRHKLLYMISISCAARLKVYMLKGGQDDIFDTRRRKFEIVGDQTLGDYFVITMGLQIAMQKYVVKPTTWDSIDVKFLYKLSTFASLQLHERVNAEWEKYCKQGELEDEDDIEIRCLVAHNFMRMENYEKAFKMFDYLGQLTGYDAGTKSRVLIDGCNCLYKMRLYVDAMKHIPKAKTVLKGLDLTDEDRGYRLGTLANIEGQCEKELKLYNKAIGCFQDATKYYQSLHTNDKNVYIATNHVEIGLCRIAQDEWKEAIISVNNAIAKFQAEKYYTTELCGCLMMVGRCYFHLEQYSEAKKAYEEALNYRIKLLPPEQHACDIAIRTCKNKLQHIIILQQLAQLIV